METEIVQALQLLQRPPLTEENEVTGISGSIGVQRHEVQIIPLDTLKL